MYAADLSAISLDDFERALLAVELIPSRRVLREHIGAVCERLRERGLGDLEGLRLLLRDKKRYPELASELSVDPEYLTLLNREVNSYGTRPVALARLVGVPREDLEALESAGIHTSEDLYERAAGKAHRRAVAGATGLAEDRLLYVLELSDLVRITGVGPASAHVLHDIGIHGPGDYAATASETILQRYADHTEARRAPDPQVGGHRILPSLLRGPVGRHRTLKLRPPERQAWRRPRAVALPAGWRGR